jgi:hypothetical protein
LSQLIHQSLRVWTSDATTNPLKQPGNKCVNL